MKFQRELVHEIFHETKPLLEKHWKEIAHYQDIALDPDFDQYERLENSGALRTFTARTEDNSLVGYAVFFVRANIHYKSSIQAAQDVLFIDPNHRGFGRDFIVWCDEELRKEGVQAVYHHVKAAHNFGPLLERLGYELVDLIYGRRID